MISVVIPVYKNQETVEELYLQLKKVLPDRHEIIFIDDASPDGAFQILQKLPVTCFRFEKNVGQHRAVLKGLEMSQGSIVITLDADLQDSPAHIPQLVEKLTNGYEAVFAGRRGNYESRFRLLTSKIFKTLLHKISGLPRDAGMFVAMSRKMVDAVLKIPMPSPFVVAMIGITGLPTFSIPVERQKRLKEESAYTNWMRLKMGMTSLFQTFRLRSNAEHQRKYYSKGDHENIFPDNYPLYIQKHLSEALKHLPDTPLQILDIGCGMGRFTIPLSRTIHKVEGLEISPVLLEKFKTYEKGIPLHCADLYHPPADLKGKFDVVIGFFVLHHLYDLEKAFQNISTFLKQGGKVVFIEPNPYNFLYYLQILFTPKMQWKNEKHMLSMRRSPMASAMRKAGIQEFKMRRFGFFPPFLSHLKIERKLEKFPPFRPILPFQLFHGVKE